MAEQPNLVPLKEIMDEWSQFLRQEQNTNSKSQQNHKHPLNIKVKNLVLDYDRSTQQSKKEDKDRGQLQKAKIDVEKAFQSILSQRKTQPQITQLQNPLRLQYEKMLAEKERKTKEKEQSLFKMQSDNRSLKAKIQDQKSQLDKKERIITSLRNKIKKAQNSLSLIRKQFQELKNTLHQLKSKLGKKDFGSEFSDIITQKISRFMANKRVEANNQLNDQKEALSLEMQKIFAQLQLQQRDVCRIAKINLPLQLPPQEKVKNFYKQMLNYIIYQSSFSDSQIIAELTQKQWLMKHVGQTIGGKIFKTQLIFKLDQFNKTNFHKYIDKKYNIMLLVKLANGTVIGGFCHTPIEKDRVEKHKKGFLFSLTLNEKFQPKSENQTLVSFDDFFLIFGNSEIRIKTLQTKVFSNFGTNSGAFNSHGKKVGDFLGANSSEQPLSHYQIYQISNLDS